MGLKGPYFSAFPQQGVRLQVPEDLEHPLCRRRAALSCFRIQRNLSQVVFIHSEAKLAFDKRVDCEGEVLEKEQSLQTADTMEKCRRDLERVLQQIMAFLHQRLIAGVDDVDVQGRESQAASRAAGMIRVDNVTIFS
jgi:hypothetical protein